MSDPLAAYLAEKQASVAPRAATPAPNDDPELAFLRPGGDPLAAYLAEKSAPAAGRVFPNAHLDTLQADLAAQVPPELKRTLGGDVRAAGHHLAETARLTGKAVGETYTTNGAVLLDPRARRNMLRGISDQVTLGYGQRLADAAGRAVGVSEAELLSGTEAADQAAYPEFRTAGNVAGMFIPGASRAIANFVPGVARGLGAAAAPAGNLIDQAAIGAAKGVAGYEAAAPLTAALSADASGHRLQAAGDAATDLAGIATSGALGAAAEPIGRNLTENARARATKDIGKDIVAAEGPRARVTDQKRIAEVNDRLFEMTKELPALRSIWRAPAEKALPRLAAIKKAVAGPLDRLCAELDARTGGGVRLGDVVDGFTAEADQLAKRPSGIPDAERLRGLAKKFEESYGGTQLGMDSRIPSSEFRGEVTNLHKTAEAAMGGLEGSARHEALTKLYEVGKDILDKHIDGAGLATGDLAQLRKINDRYFLLSRAEAAIESRGWKESNRPGFHLPHSAAAAVRTGGVLAPVAYGVTHPHAILPMATAYGVAHAAPAVAARANWRLANVQPGAAAQIPVAAGAGIARLMFMARQGAQPQAIVAAGAEAGVDPALVQRIAASGGAPAGATPAP